MRLWQIWTTMKKLALAMLVAAVALEAVLQAGALVVAV